MNKRGLVQGMIVAVVFFTVLTVYLWLGAGNLQAQTDNSSIAKIKAAGKLVIGTSADYPPYEFHLLNDKDGDLVGIDIEIAKVIAQELGVKLEVKDLIFSRIFTCLEAGQIDLAIAGLHPTEERKKIASFSDTYYQAIQSIVILKENIDKIKTIEDLRGKKVATQKDSIQESMAVQQIAGAEFISRETIEELVISLKKGLVDAIILEKPVADSYLSQEKNFANLQCDSFSNMLGSAIAVKKGNTELLTEINRILAKLRDENRIQEFIDNAKIQTDKR